MRIVAFAICCLATSAVGCGKDNASDTGPEKSHSPSAAASAAAVTLHVPGMVERLALT